VINPLKPSFLNTHYIKMDVVILRSFKPIVLGVLGFLLYSECVFYSVSGSSQPLIMLPFLQDTLKLWLHFER
jgi:hypothetical protein